MNKSAYFIREQDVNLLGLDNRRYLAEAEGRMRHCLSFSICASPIIRRAVFSRRAGGYRCFAFFECSLYAAFRTVYSRNLTSLVKRDYHVSSLHAATYA